MKRRRLIIALLLAAFVALAGWWSLFFPYSARGLYAAIPQEATFISEHLGLSSRWRSVARNPLTSALLESMGVDKAAVEEVLSDPLVDRYVRKLASRQTIVAYAPALGPSGSPAWVLASWAGAHGQWTKMELLLGVLDGLRRVRVPGMPAVWMVEGADDSSWRLSLTLVEGVLLGCYSQDAAGVRFVAERVRRGRPPAPVLAARLAGGRREAAEGPRDRFWMDGVQEVGAELHLRRLTAALSRFDEQGISGRIRAYVPREWMEGIRPVSGGRGLRSLCDTLGDAPDMIVVFPAALLTSLLPEEDARLILAACRGGDGLAFVALLGEEYSGRLLGIRVPAVAAGVETTDEDAARSGLPGMIDQFNSEYAWGLIARDVHAGGRWLTALDSTRSGIYGNLRPGEGPALAVESGWLLAASNMNALEKLLTTARSSGGWAAGLPGRQASAYAWGDVRAADHALRNALAFYSLALLANPSAGTEETRRHLESAKAWLAALRDLGTMRMWATAEGGEVEISFELGVDSGVASASEWEN